MIVLGLFCALLFIYSLISKRARNMIITAPMIFATAGILIVFLSPKLFAGDFDNTWHCAVDAV